MTKEERAGLLADAERKLIDDSIRMVEHAQRLGGTTILTVDLERMTEHVGDLLELRKAAT